MKYKQNLHTHTNYCHGHDSVRELIEAAIEKGFDSLGFSSHAFFSRDEDYTMTPEKTEKYNEEVTLMKAEYEGKIKIYCGIEQDIFCPGDISFYDYVIGSVHHLAFEDVVIEFDDSAEFVRALIDTRFGGDGMKYAKKYFETLATLPEYGKFDIIGHFDLITKHRDNVQFFDESSKEYLGYVIEAAEALRHKIPLFEINSGGIARGYHKDPYPSVYILKELRRLGFGAVITSDCHDRNFLDCHFAESAELLRECGFDCKYVFTDEGFVPAEL